MKKKLLAFLFLLAISLTACNGQNEGVEDSGKAVVYTSFYPIYNLTEIIVEDTVDLRTFMPANQDPHLWEPTPKDMRDLADADLLIVNGANMEVWLDQVRENLPDLDILVLSESVDLITYKGAAAKGDFQYMSTAELDKGKEYEINFGHTHEPMMRVAFFKRDGRSEEELIKEGKKIMEEDGKLVKQREIIDVEDGKLYSVEMGHEKGFVYYNLPEDDEWVFVSDRLSEAILSYSLLDENKEALDEEVILEGSTSSLDKVSYDPHSWLSITNAKSYLMDITNAMNDIAPEYSRMYDKNKSAAVAELTSMEYEYADIFSDKKVNEFVTSHNAYGYIARDFDLIQFPLNNLVSTEEPSMKVIRTAIDFCQYNGVDTIFYEYQGNSKSAESLATELDGGKAVPLISMEYADNLQRLDEDEKDYISIMRYNLDSIAEAVGADLGEDSAQGGGSDGN